MKIKVSIIICIILQSLSQAQSWIPKGVPVNGTSSSDNFGWSTCMPDANTLAIGAVSNDAGGSTAGQVKIYKWTGSNWTPKGNPINGSAAAENLGWSICMPDSNNIVIGCRMPLGTGKVKTYQWNGSAWILRGSVINGNSDDELGYSVSMPDVNTIAVGAPYHDDSMQNNGQVKVYKWNGTDWAIKGSAINGSVAGDLLGWSISMPDTNTLAIGVPYYDADTISTGQVKIYSWVDSNWVLKGQAINGVALGELAGWSVSMPNENTISIGAILNDNGANDAGQVRIYVWNGISWSQKGGAISGSVAMSHFGQCVSMADSNTIAIGLIGQARAYKWNGNTWLLMGSAITGSTTEATGYSVTMANTRTLAVGSPNKYLNQNFNPGQVRVYRFCGNTTSSITVSSCSSFISPSGKAYQYTGTYIDTIPNSSNCDSIITINFTGKTLRTLTDTACGNYTSPSGKTYNISGTYTDTLTNSAGCDSIITINLTVNSTVNTITTSSCYSYTSPSGRIFNLSGTYNDTIVGIGNCDNILTINLTINTRTYSTLNINTCNNYISPSGNTYSTSGTYTDTIVNSSGCDSVITINLIIKNNTTGIITDSLCGTYISPSGKTYTTSGTYRDTIPNTAGCDSIITIYFTKGRIYHTINEFACGFYTLPNGNTVTLSGSYGYLVQNPIGCDSVITINYTINSDNFTSSISPTACQTYTSASGKIFTSSGVYNDTILSSSGCQNIVTINLTINHNTSFNTSAITCGSYISPSGNTYSTSGTYTDTIANSSGCDSIITLNLVINNTAYTNLPITACGRYIGTSGTVYTASGLYYDTLTSSTGCDSVIELQLTIIDLPEPIIIRSNDSLFAGHFTSYEWLINGILSGISDSVLVVTQPGEYKVVVSDNNGCTDTSDSYFVTGVSISEVCADNEIIIYPNPAQSYFVVKSKKDLWQASIIVTNILGEIVTEIKSENGYNFVGDASNLAKGIYILKLTQQGKVLSTQKLTITN